MGDLLFVGSCNGILHGLDRHTGEARWTYKATLDGGKPEFHGRPLVTTELIVIGSDDRRRDGIGYVYAFDRSALTLRWKHHAGAGVMTDVLARGRTAYVVTLSDELIALDLQTGALQWRFASGGSNDRFLINSTPAIADDRIIFGGLNGIVYALNGRSGAVLWQRDLHARVSTSVARVDDDLFVGDANGRIHKLDVATGATKAQLDIKGSVNFKLVPVAQSLLAFVNEANVTTLKSVPLTLDDVRWTQAAPGPGWSSFAWPYVWKDWVVVGRDTGEFVALRLVDGRPGWEGKVTGAIAGIGGDDTSLYLGTSGGRLYAYTLPSDARR